MQNTLVLKLHELTTKDALASQLLSVTPEAYSVERIGKEVFVHNIHGVCIGFIYTLEDGKSENFYRYEIREEKRLAVKNDYSVSTKKTN